MLEHDKCRGELKGQRKGNSELAIVLRLQEEASVFKGVIKIGFLSKKP